jgi:predicted sugar kinase
MEKQEIMSNTIHDRAVSKAFAKVIALKMDIRALADDVKCSRTGGVSIEELRNGA